MKVASHRVVAISYALTDERGATLERLEPDHPMVYLHGRGVLLLALEKALEGLSAGDPFDVTLPPEQAYGDHHDRLVQKVPRESFGPQADALHRGASVSFAVGQGEEARTLRFWVTKIREDTVTLDGNHPLAGKTLHFVGRVEAVREPTGEERQAAERGEF